MCAPKALLTIISCNSPPKGALMDAIHRSCSFARVIEAAQRDYGYVSADMPTYAALMNSELDK
jgi:hypothetical protein